MRQQVPMVFLLVFYLGAVAYIYRNKFGLMLAQGYFKGQRSSIVHKLQLFMTVWYAIIEW